MSAVADTASHGNAYLECVPLCGIWLDHSQQRWLQRLGSDLSQSAVIASALQRRLLRLQ